MTPSQIQKPSQPERASCFFQSDVGRAVDELLYQDAGGYPGHRKIKFAEEAAQKLKDWAKLERERLGPDPDDGE